MWPFNKVFRKGGTSNVRRFLTTYGTSSDEAVVKGDKLLIFSGYGGQARRWFTVSDELKGIAESAFRDASSAELERKALANVLGSFEAAYSKKLGLKDRKGLDFTGSGDKTQLDCVDEAWNATIVIMWLESQGLLKHHKLMEPMAKWGIFKWNHYAAIVKENEGGKLWAIDGGVGPGGAPPMIMSADSWYE